MLYRWWFYIHHLRDSESNSAAPRSATVSVAQNNSSEAADSQCSDFTSELPRAIQNRHPHTNLADIAHHRTQLFLEIPYHYTRQIFKLCFSPAYKSAFGVSM
jgi:hypothetical protein